ncbi:MAG: WG repeat-containing protein [Bacteroidetes bacterium]|nr:MAG: WG repeat-containing protein [Bacteroidota bacterium]
MKKLTFLLFCVLSTSLAWSQYWPIQKGEKWGFIDSTGKEVVPPIYTEARPFSEGFAAVSVSREGEFTKWYYINDSFQMKIKFGFADALPFQEGLAPVKTYRGWNYVNTAGDLKIKGDYDSAMQFTGGYARVKLNGYWALIDKEGRYIRNPNFTALTDYAERHLGVLHKDGQYWQLTALSGDTLSQDTFAFLGNFVGGWAPAKQDNHYFYINYQGKKTLDPYVEEAWPFYGKYASVKENGFWFLMDKQGRVYRDLQLKFPVNFNSYLTWVELVNGRKGYMNREGEWVYRVG